MRYSVGKYIDPAEQADRDALQSMFPQCSAGHYQAMKWKPSRGCKQCKRLAEAEASREAEAADVAKCREETAAFKRNIPAVIRIRVVDTGKVHEFRCPPRSRRR